MLIRHVATLVSGAVRRLMAAGRVHMRLPLRWLTAELAISLVLELANSRRQGRLCALCHARCMGQARPGCGP
jgi:hypothetical protein